MPNKPSPPPSRLLGESQEPPKPAKAKPQLLHVVIGGELVSLTGAVEFRDLKNVEFVGAYPNYAEAVLAWRGRAQQTVDNALMRFFVLHAHKLINPAEDWHGGGDR